MDGGDVMSLEGRAAVHAALADPARLRITDVLGAGDASPSELAALMSMPSNLRALHVRVLEEAALVARRPSDGRRRRMLRRLVPTTLDSLAGLGLLPARRV